MQKYRLYIYEVWGNARDGFEVNDVWRTDTVIEIAESTTDYQINRKLGARNCAWDGEWGYTLYATNKRNGRPEGELRKID